MTARVSAILVSYYTGPVLARSIAALRDDPAVAEVIVVDNGNWPGAVEAALGEGAAPVRILGDHGNIGFAAACNLGAKAAAGEMLLFVNPDAVMPQGGLAQLLSDADRLPRPFMIGPKLVDPDGAEQQGSRRATLTPWRAFVEATQLYKLAPRHPHFRRFNLHRDPCPEDVVPVPTISGACFLIRRDDYFAIGGMDERYFLHVEDVDFALRFGKAGGGVFFDPHVCVMHYKSSSRVDPISIDLRKTASMIRYFDTHFADTYPAPARGGIAAALWVLFGARSLARLGARSASLVGLGARKGPHAATRARAIARRASR